MFKEKAMLVWESIDFFFEEELCATSLLVFLEGVGKMCRSREYGKSIRD